VGPAENEPKPSQRISEIANRDFIQERRSRGLRALSGVRGFHLERPGTIFANWSDAIQAKPYCRIAAMSPVKDVDCFLRQGLRLTVEQCLHRQPGTVAGARWFPGRIARLSDNSEIAADILWSHSDLD
jgi:hypothetical protein